jgi:hypothetical protein
MLISQAINSGEVRLTFTSQTLDSCPNRQYYNLGNRLLLGTTVASRRVNNLNVCPTKRYREKRVW